jgi:3-deoxy-7-phosphoheptulonate synthase
MIIVFDLEASRRDIDHVVRRAASLRLKTHVSQQGGRTRVGLHGDLNGLDPSVFSGLPGVQDVRILTRPFHLASREFKDEATHVHVGDRVVGGDTLILMAGPCSVETRDQMMRVGSAVREAGASFIRGGAFKPRSSPYSFRGLAEEGLQILAEVREATGLLVVTEVMSPEQVGLVAGYADVFQIGARNMQNYALLDAVGRAGRPVLLKRGMSSTVEELLLSAEYILSHGNPDVILCERGIRTFETMTRNTLDINSVPLLHELTHLPVVVDPSHGTGKASLVPAVSRAAVAAGADGLLIEVHHDPANAWSDGDQSITGEAFSRLSPQLIRIREALAT